MEATKKCFISLGREKILPDSKSTDNIIKNVKIKIDHGQVYITAEKTEKIFQMQQDDTCSSEKIEIRLTKDDAIFNDAVSNRSNELTLRGRKIERVIGPKIGTTKTTKPVKISNENISNAVSNRSDELTLRGRTIERVIGPTIETTKTTTKPAKISNENDGSASKDSRLRKRKEENANCIVEPAKNKIKIAIKKFPKNNKPIKQNQIVLAKMRSYAPWPVQVRKVEKNRCEVFFFGTNQT